MSPYKMRDSLSLVPGEATGDILWTDTPISFYGGVDPTTGQIIDLHHPLCGSSIKGRILAIPGGRGSCAGSGGMLELLHAGHSPAGLVFSQPELLVTLGVWVAQEMFGISIPVLVVPSSVFLQLQKIYGQPATITNSYLQIGYQPLEIPLSPFSTKQNDGKPFPLSPEDKDILNGKMGEAARLAMKVIIRFSEAQGADGLIDICQAHIDACVYVGPTSLFFSQRLLDLGGRVAVPSTMNSLNADRRRWKELGCDPELSTNASALGDAYLKMGAKASFTCAPYTLETAPEFGDQIGWAESNAVVFANSVLGAKTQKYPDYLDVFIALTGRAPNFNAHTKNGRLPTICIDFDELTEFDDSLFPLLGYRVGELVGAEIPIVLGLHNTSAGIPELKAFGAAFATTSAAPMFHIHGITPESSEVEHLISSITHIRVSLKDLRMCWEKLNTGVDNSVAVASLGNPHFAFEEFARLAELCKGRQRCTQTQMMITTNREAYEQSARAGFVDILVQFGADFITDTCWCLIGESVIPLEAKNLMTNSAKYAHYGPGTTKRGIHFGSLRDCVNAAVHGTNERVMPTWLLAEGPIRI
ncbi:unnamed protein product [Penicillium salamii]|uniref:DUF521 domain protein n=1 Tax=Penicillium salamii TaxID=1612424 RepID=A0A9W4J047_9EURO|nr:unnamed protein product [Penicillium salamii]CAG8407734.1 unnamed protein product [Penicillium salamii]CAG8413292.1 unnamed protein product [Penicillium salamii]CAG8422278.1 unnamed protein product [Penicillium salamii]